MDGSVEGLSLEDWIDTLDSNSPEESVCERLARDLWQAVEDGSIENVRSLLEQKADPDHEVFWSEEWVKVNYPPLHTACSDSNLEIAKELVNAGANIDASGGWNGSTPLHLACSFGCKEAVDYLIREAECTVDVRDDDGQSPLDRVLEDVDYEDNLDLGLYLINHGCGGDEGKVKLMCVACFWSKLDVVKELVELHKVDPNDVRNDEGQSPLDRAFDDMYEIGRFDLVVYLISHGCGDGKDRAIVLAQACHQGRLDVVKELIEQHKVDPKDVRDDHGQSPLDRVLKDVDYKDDLEYRLDLCLYLIKHGCCGDEGIMVKLMCEACYWGRLDMVKELVEQHKVDPKDVRDDHGQSPLDRALEDVDDEDDLDLGLYLINHGCGGYEGKVELMCEACCWDRLDVVKELVELHKVDPKDVKDKDNRSLLHLACEDINQDLVEYLVEEANCDVNVRDDNGQSPLDRALEDVDDEDHLDLGLYLVSHGCGGYEGKVKLMCGACSWGSQDVVEELVELHNVDPREMKDKYNKSPLHLACESGSKGVVRYLVEEANCDINEKDKENRSPLHWACENGNEGVVEYLIEEANCDVNEKDKDNKSPLHLACEEGNGHVVKYLVEKYLVEKASCDVNVRDDDDMSPFDVACVRGHTYIVWYLVEKANCDVNMRDKNNQTPLHKCCGSWRNNLEVVQYLVENTNCDFNARDDQGRTPLDTAIENNTGAALYLVNRVPGMRGDKERGKLLCRACNSGELDIVKEQIIKHKVDPEDVRDEDNKSPLHLACEGGHKHVVQYLVEKANCDVNVKDKEDRSLLHLACEGGQKDVVEYLVEKANCDVNVRDQDKSSPLHLACEGGHKGVVKYLVEEANCDVNIRDKNNQTPLHKSCGSWCFTLDMVQCLVENTNCDINVSDDKGKTPLDLATERSTDTALSKHVRKKWTKVVDYLKSVPGAQNVTDCRDMTSLDLAIDTRLDQDQRAVPTEHSAGQKRVSSENHESRPPPSKQPRIQNDSTTPPRRTCPECNQLCDIHCKKCPNPQCGQKLPPIRSCPECNRSCHVRCKKCPHPQCGYTFPPTSKSKATGEAKKNPASLLQILQKKVEQLGQNGYNVAVMVHKPNPERDTFNKYSTDGPARDYIDSPDVFNNWKEHFKKNNRAAGTSSGGAYTAGTSGGGADTAGTSSGGAYTAGTSSGGADTAGTSSGSDTAGTSSGADTTGTSGGADTAGTSSGGSGGGASVTSSASGRVSLSPDQMSAIVQEVLKQMQKKT